MATREQGRHNRGRAYCAKCNAVMRSLPRHNRRHHGGDPQPADAETPLFRTGWEIVEERARTLSFDLEAEKAAHDGGITGEAFDALGLPLVVACSGCEMTMAFPNSYVDQHGRIWCDDCGGGAPPAGNAYTNDPQRRYEETGRL